MRGKDREKEKGNYVNIWRRIEEREITLIVGGGYHAIYCDENYHNLGTVN